MSIQNRHQWHQLSGCFEFCRSKEKKGRSDKMLSLPIARETGSSKWGRCEYIRVALGRKRPCFLTPQLDEPVSRTLSYLSCPLWCCPKSKEKEKEKEKAKEKNKTFITVSY